MKGFILFLICSLFLVGSRYAQTPTPSYDPSEWFMAGANPQRTSHVDSTPENQTEIPGKLYPEWFIPLEPYIPYGWQLVIADDTIFVSTARGLYAIDINAGDLYSQNPNDPDKPWLKWVFPTELPLGQSPTVVKNSQGEYIAYVGGFDKKVYAIKADPASDKISIDQTTQQRINDDVVWTFDAQEYWNNTEPQEQHIAAGFNTNPLVVDNEVFLGNRDGYLYALDQTNGNLLWHFKTDGPILFSAATNLDNSVIYFASNDMHGYAVRASDGKLDAQTIPGTWKTAKFPGSGFFSWWPVVTRQVDPQDGQKKEYVIFAGSNNYRAAVVPGSGDAVLFQQLELEDIYPNHMVDPEGTFVSQHFIAGSSEDTVGISWPWLDGVRVLNTSKPNDVGNGKTTAITEYFEDNGIVDLAGKDHKPWRRTVFIVNATTGTEFTYDSDSDNNREYAPFLWKGTQSGSRYPAIIGQDNSIYFQNDFLSNQYIPWGGVTGWEFGTPYLRIATTNWAIDEPRAVSMGGNILYWNRNSAFDSGAIDISSTSGTTWMYYSNYSLRTLIPGYNQYLTTGGQMFGNVNGVYAQHGNQNPPIPYKGKVYEQRGNSIISFKASQTATIPAVPKVTSIIVAENSQEQNKGELRSRLSREIEKMVAAGHLKPGYVSSGFIDFWLSGDDRGDLLMEYWAHPFDTIVILARSIPYLPTTADANFPQGLQEAAKNYLRQEFQAYPPYMYNFIGWKEGASREVFELPPEVVGDMNNIGPLKSTYKFPSGWSFNPQSFYALWSYINVLKLSNTEAQSLFNTANNNTTLTNSFYPVPADMVLMQKPEVLNAFITGYIGYLNIQEYLGIPKSSTYQNELNRMVMFRVNSFTKDSPIDVNDSSGNRYERSLNASRNFLYMVPDFLDYLKKYDQENGTGYYQQFISKVQGHYDEYNTITPYWFVSQFDNTFGEGVNQPLYDYHSLFQAKAQILDEPYEELVKYLDVPAVERGDLFYIDNLVSLLEASSSANITPTPSGTPQPGDTDGDGDVDIFDYNAVITDFGKTGVQGFSNADFDGDGDVDIFDYNVVISNFGR